MFKKNVFTSLLLVVAFAQQASANSGDIQFVGSVSTQTCDIKPVVGGTTKNDIDLGNIEYTAAAAKAVNNGKVVSFSLVPAAGCTNANGADVSWVGSSFNNAGLSNVQGTAQGISVKLATDDASPQDININHQTAGFAKGVNEFKFNAQMVADESAEVKPGSVIAHASYSVAYK
nr:fimbrial protein [Pantoea agglomerans]